MPATETSSSPQVSVIIPARNEEASLGACLESIVAQTGIPFEIIVVDDHSTDRTSEIAASFQNVRVIEAGPLPPGWTGKNNAVTAGARAARGSWLLFTDADTIHLPGSLVVAFTEAEEHHADMLSYSPAQIAITFWEMAVLPVVFAELARQYPPSKVSDPSSPEAAANGQYILITREAYDAVGGHAAVATSILEDVALARAVKASGRKIRFRYAADAVRTRMYRNFSQLREGWTKNLALLFPNPGRLALKTLLLWLFWVTLWMAAAVANVGKAWWNFADVAVFVLLAIRLRRSQFRWDRLVIAAIFGTPMFAYLLVRSKRAHAQGDISWKGRSYGGRREEGRSKEEKKEPHLDDSRKTCMKRALPLFLLIVLTSLWAMVGVHPSLAAQSGSDSPTFLNTIIDPGLAVGSLKIGDTRDRALALFPKKPEDQEWDDPCGSTIDWVDTTNPNGRGDLFIRLKKGKIFQIESSTTRFHTAEGITTFDPPSKVAQSYKDLRAWVLLTPPSPALGDRPLIFWGDKKRGIAFVFAYDPSHQKRYVYKVMVFLPGHDFCPELEKPTSSKWQVIAPYSLEPPIELEPQ